MILVDTSIWADHFGRRDDNLDLLLKEGVALGHPFVTAEIALGDLADPAGTIMMLESLPQALVASHRELMLLIARDRLAGSGIGFVDAHLLAACQLSAANIWTRDKRLRAQAVKLGISWQPS
jgi:predicted nucleic acid-binding protein